MGPWDRPRDPARIDAVLDAVREAWEREPDIRLGQLIGNAASRAGREAQLIEDEKLVEALSEPAR